MPNYIVIGAPKCGTSSLCDLLGQHPDVFMSEPKEIHYFGRDDEKKTPAWYRAHFDAAAGKKAVGEGSTSYTHPDIIRRCADEIATQIPDCRLIYMVRNPLKRLESDWKMRAHEGWSKGESINESVDQQPTLITHGAYWANINVYRERFRDDQILIVFLENFSRDPNTELARCFAHLGVAPWSGVVNPERPRNAANDYGRDRQWTRVLRAAKPLRLLKQRMPAWMVDASRSVLVERKEYKVEWDPAVRSRVVGALEEDAGRFLEFYGKSRDFWKYQ
jgi:hypothetical protein